MTISPDWTSLRIFLAALELGSIARAAEHCGIANSAAAKRMQMLEAEARTPLLERRARGVAPTAAGEVFAAQARALMEMGERLNADFEAFVAGGAGVVRLAATASSIGGTDLAPALAAFAAAHPRITVETRETTSASALFTLMEAKADLAIITSDAAIPADLAAAQWRSDRLTVIMAATHPLASQLSVKFSEALQFPMIEVMENAALTLMLAAEARKLGRAPMYRYRVASMDAARRLSASGLAVAVMPGGLAEPYAQALGLKHLRIDEPWARRRLRLVSRPEGALSGPARRLREHLLAPQADPSGRRLDV